VPYRPKGVSTIYVNITAAAPTIGDFLGINYDVASGYFKSCISFQFSNNLITSNSSVFLFEFLQKQAVSLAKTTFLINAAELSASEFSGLVNRSLLMYYLTRCSSISTSPVPRAAASRSSTACRRAFLDRSSSY
jgi:hypothetical protein